MCVCVCVCGEILVQPAAVPGSLIGQIRSGPTHIRKSILVGDLLKADQKKIRCQVREPYRYVYVCCAKVQ